MAVVVLSARRRFSLLMRGRRWRSACSVLVGGENRQRKILYCGSTSDGGENLGDSIIWHIHLSVAFCLE